MAELLARRSREGRLTLVTVTLGSGIALLDGTVVNIAVKYIGADLHASLAQLQWVVNGYMLSLAALILVGGALGDRLGRRRVYVVGVAGFGIASGLCALAPTADALVLLRVVQGVFAALLTPGSLAILQSGFRREDRAPAIGIWAGVSGIATALGPVIGGVVLDNASWRWIFAINVPLCAVVVLLSRYVPETRDTEGTGRFDVRGASAGVVALGVTTYLLTSWPSLAPTAIVPLGVAAVVVWVLFVRWERRPGAMVPLRLFASAVFSAANLMTFLVYGALAAALFLLVLQLEVSAGYPALQAGLASLPITIAMLLLSPRFAALAQRTGPRMPMSIGPVLCAVGTVLLSQVSRGATYWTAVFPGMVVFALGLSLLVAPLTAAVLAAAPDHLSGIASGINNAVARAGSLLAVAALPAAVGLTGEDYRDPARLTSGFERAELVCAALLFAGGIVSAIGLRRVGTAVTS